MFFARQEKTAIIEAVKYFEKNRGCITAENCRENAERFGIERFRDEFGKYVKEKIEELYLK